MSYFKYNYSSENDRVDFYVKEHRFYWTPSEYNTRYQLERRKLGLDNIDFAKELARFYYHKMVMDKDFHEEKWRPENVPLLKEDEQKKAEQKQGFYDQVWQKFMPGTTPLDKAMNLLVLMSKNNKKNKALEEMDADDMVEVFQNTPGEEIFESRELKDLLAHRDIEDFDKKVEILQRIALIEDFGKSFEIKKLINDKRVFNSDIHKLKRMSEYSELIRTPLYQRKLPNYHIKLATKDLIATTPIRKEESKQKIIILLDFSGSMHNKVKQDWVLSILADRLRYCMKEECEIFFSYFLTESEIKKNFFKFEHIYNAETAMRFFKSFSTAPNGGDTEVGKVVEAVRYEIMENHKLFNLNIDLSKEQPEILVINDGNDSVKADKLTWKTNAITLLQENKQLEGLCQKTDGKYVYIEGSMYS